MLPLLIPILLVSAFVVGSVNYDKTHSTGVAKPPAPPISSAEAGSLGRSN